MNGTHDGSTTPAPNGHPHHIHLPFHHQQHKSHRLHHLIHPNGKHYHIVDHPTEIDRKRRELTEDEKHGTVDYEVVVYGATEHLACVRDVQNHHLSRRATMRAKNAELFEEFDELHETLDHLSDELDRLTNHAVAFDASFSKFGYNATIRTKDDLENSSLKSASTNEDQNSAQDRHQDRSMEPIKFWKTPTIRQYFHKGLLWRSARSGEVGTFELFTDLIYVGVIDSIGEIAVQNASAETVLRYVVVFTLAYKIWADLTTAVNWFEVEDVVGRFLILFVLCCLYGFNSNVEYFFEHTFTAGISFYLTQRLFFISVFVTVGFIIPMVRGSLFSQAAIGLLACTLYIVSAHVEYPYNLAPLFLALFVEYIGAIVLIGLIRYIKNKEGCSTTCRKLAKSFDFIPAINIEHRVERTGAFTTLVFGYSILKSLYQSSAHVGVNAYLGKGILVVIQAFTIMWLYFDIDANFVHVHAIRRHWFTTSIWIVVHLPLSGAFILASSTLNTLVLAHDCINSNIEDLAEPYASDSVAELEQPLRWFYCTGLGLTLLCMTIISTTHIHKKDTYPRLSKPIRLTIRLIISTILICLPFAPSHTLPSLSLLATTTSLFILVLTLDIFGNSCPGEKFWTGGYGNCPATRCKYTARIRVSRKKRTDLQRRLVRGEGVGLRDVLGRTGSLGSESTLNEGGGGRAGEQWCMGH